MKPFPIFLLGILLFSACSDNEQDQGETDKSIQDSGKSVTVELRSFLFEGISGMDGIWPPESTPVFESSSSLGFKGLGDSSNVNNSEVSTSEELYSEMQSIYDAIGELINDELGILSQLKLQGESITENQLLESVEEFESFQDAIQTASGIHDLMLAKRQELVALSATASSFPDINFETVNNFIGYVEEINGLTNDAADAMRFLVYMIPQLLEKFDVENAAELDGIFQEHISSYVDVYEILVAPRENLLRLEIYEHGYEIMTQQLGIEGYEALSIDQKIEKFQQHNAIAVEEVNRFKGYYESAKEIDKAFEDYALGLVYDFNKNYVLTFGSAARISPEAAYRYSVQNAWKRNILFRYTEAKLNNWYENEYRDWEASDRNSLISESTLGLLNAIKDENDLLAPEYGPLDLSSDGVSWPGYDTNFESQYFVGGRLEYFQQTVDYLLSYING
ncbi:MAG: hypothetical protein RLZZ241_628 [Bacteroidota bacterium]|jgi:hypothetical protein